MKFADRSLSTLIRRSELYCYLNQGLIEPTELGRHPMIHGAHFLFYSTDAEADRAFVRDVLGFGSVDAGQGWLIFALPPSEAAFHPLDADGEASSFAQGWLYLMCDELDATIRNLESKGVRCAEPVSERWGIRTTFSLPSGQEVGLYQPTHPTAI